MKKDKTVFIEYSTAQRGQHFITVVQYDENGTRTITGRIYREFNTETKKPEYTAKDWQDNPVFIDEKDLYKLKKKFIENGKSMAQARPKGLIRTPHKTKVPHQDRTNRAKELKTIRKGPEPKTKESGKEETISSTNNIPEKVDRTVPRDPDFDSPEGTENGQNFMSPFQDEFDREEIEQNREQNEEYERMMDLEDLREQQADNERVQEMDRDL